MAQLPDQRLTRRDFVAVGAAALVATTLPGRAVGQKATYRRYNVSGDAIPPKVLESYKAAIRKMLSLPPTDPLNWYRNAFIHTLDCPHGNWWFLPWHRAYLGWFELKCRELSGDSEFALPYWDWTTTPRIPAAMFDDVLDPNHEKYIAHFDDFKDSFGTPVDALFENFSADRMGQLVARGYNSAKQKSAADFWDRNHPLGVPNMFWDRGTARGLTAANPNLNDDTKSTVLKPWIQLALREPIFAGGQDPEEREGFGSPAAKNHSFMDDGGGRQGVLETGPHNHIHGGMQKGFMVDLLSPVDPIFFLHHTNIDRLWDIWTRQQAAKNPPQPSLPDGDKFTSWSTEQFLFFVDEKGKPVSKTDAGDYAAMNSFDYDYEPGSFDKVSHLAAPLPPSVQPFQAQISAEAFGFKESPGGVADVPSDRLQPSGPETPPRLIEVTLNLTPGDRYRTFRVLVSAAGQEPIQAGTIVPFGGHSFMGPTTFALPLPESLNIPAKAEVALDIRVVPIEEEGVAAAHPQAPPPKGHPAEGIKPTKPIEEAPHIPTPTSRVTAIRVRTD